MNPIIKTNKAKHVLLRVQLHNGTPIEIKLVGTRDPRADVWREAYALNLVADYEIVEVSGTVKVIETV
jgi:hypothetical protein